MFFLIIRDFFIEFVLIIFFNLNGKGIEELYKDFILFWIELVFFIFI